ncbi:hypothetical protein [Kineosporia sp. A_224]|uniref:hypothetical protein n=1 Tax=Kineosporia sp. A_224 TaxID=1962180 RepID=UPI000B4A959C|nr:hypothetical protein [Kineosporia sp. A_224]
MTPRKTFVLGLAAVAAAVVAGGGTFVALAPASATAPLSTVRLTSGSDDTSPPSVRSDDRSGTPSDDSTEHGSDDSTEHGSDDSTEHGSDDSTERGSSGDSHGEHSDDEGSRS